VKLVIQSPARDDIQSQRRWYIEQGVSHIADRFRAAVFDSFKTIMSLPSVGSPRHYDNPYLEGLRVWPIKGFGQMHIYYLVRKREIVIVRILHDKRDVTAILEEKE
jgi:toxin ParE1/3/4